MVMDLYNIQSDVIVVLNYEFPSLKMGCFASLPQKKQNVYQMKGQILFRIHLKPIFPYSAKHLYLICQRMKLYFGSDDGNVLNHFRIKVTNFTIPLY